MVLQVISMGKNMRINGTYSVLALIKNIIILTHFLKNGVFNYHSGASLGDDKFGKDIM
jgi:hypothetical protein